MELEAIFYTFNWNSTRRLMTITGCVRNNLKKQGVTMNLKKYFKVVLGIASLAVIYSFGCGGSGGGWVEPTVGSAINNSWDLADLVCNGNNLTTNTYADGTGASVYVQTGVMSSCVNATTDPTIQRTTSLPTGLTINTTDGDQNVTLGGAAAGYTFNINGDRGFITTAAGAVTLTIPFDPTAIATVGDRADTTKIFIRLFDLQDNIYFNINGDISGSNITVEMRGLPKSFTAVVIYNPNMDTATPTAIAANISLGKAVTEAAPWTPKRWCAIYNSKSSVLIAAVKQKDGIAGNPTPAQIKTAVKNYIADYAVNAQNVYQAAGFRAPNVYVASKATEPCADVFGTNKRFNIQVTDAATNFTAKFISQYNYDGTINIGAPYIDDAVSVAAGSVGSTRGIVAHEMLHAIFNGHELFGTTTKGYNEGCATTYGSTIDMNDGNIYVRSSMPSETWRLSDYLSDDATNVPEAIEYATQDFFAYVGKQYNSNSLSYISGLFERMKDDVAAQVTTAGDSFKEQPSRPVLFGAMDSYFQTKFSKTLKEIYLDFLRQRAFDHNTASRFGRAGETTSGFASDLFQTSATDDTLNSVKSVTINPDDCAITGGSDGFGKVAPFAARAIMISPTKAAQSTTLPTVSVALTPNSGSVGDTWGGFSNRSSSTQSISTTNEFTNFGAVASDRIVIAVANVTQNQRTSIKYEVTCTGAGGGGGGGGDLSTFTLTDFTLPGEGTMAPAWVYLPPDLANLGWLVAMVASTSDLTETYKYKNLQVQMNSTKITAAGTYTILGNDVQTGPAAILYSPGTAAAAAGTGKVFTSTGGTITITTWGTSVGSHITGSFAATMSDGLTPATTGTMGANFDFVVGSANDL